MDCAKDNAEAEALIARGGYAVIIVDLRLSGADGTEGLQLIQAARQKWPQTSIILLTAYGSPSTEQEARRCGADQILHKPMPLPSIAKVVAGILEPPRCASPAA